MNRDYKGKRKMILACLPVPLFILLTFCTNGETFKFHNSLTTDTIPLKNLPDSFKKDTTQPENSIFKNKKTHRPNTV